MVKLAANISLMFNELDFLDRFAAAAKAGFPAVEYLFPYAYDVKELKARLDGAGLQQVLFNTAQGDFEKGERGIAALPGREDDFKRAIDVAIHYASTLKVPRLHVMAGTVAPGMDPARCESTFIANLRAAAKTAASANIVLEIEPLNHTDFPGYFLVGMPMAKRILDAVAQPNVRLQFDIYHQQMSTGQIVPALKSLFGLVEHIQIAGVPGRNEPDDKNEIHTKYLFNLLAELGYTGWVGCEYKPRAGTVAGLGWTREWGI